MAVVITTLDIPIHTSVACQKGHKKRGVMSRCRLCIYYSLGKVGKTTNNYQSSAASGNP
jgi:hypothetical protein